VIEVLLVMLMPGFVAILASHQMRESVESADETGKASGSVVERGKAMAMIVQVEGRWIRWILSIFLTRASEV